VCFSSCGDAARQDGCHAHPLTVAGVVSALLIPLAPHAAASPLPVISYPPEAIANGFSQPATVSPAGSNRWGCRNKDRHPVILLHGTSMNQLANFPYLAPVLADAGFCVFSLTYGQTSWSGNIGALARREISAREVARFLDRVVAATGAQKVDFIGHSQGGSIAQLTSQLRTSQVGTIVGLSAPSRGHSLVGSIQDRLPAARQPGENRWGPRHRSIRYVNLATRYDMISTPYQVTLMPPGPNITNIVIQDVCPASRVGHTGMPYSSTVAALVRNALDPAHRVAVPCGGPEFPL